MVNLPIGIFGLWLAFAKVAESRSPHGRRVDWAGMVTFTGGLIALVYGLTEAGQRSWTDGLVVTCFIIAAVLLVGFVVVELRVSQPMFELSLLRTPTFTGGLISAFSMNGSLFAMLLYIVLYLQNSLGYSALQTGVRLLVMFACSMVVATIAGRLSSHVPVRWLIGPGLFLVGIALMLMSGLDASSSWTHLIPGLIISGIGSGLVNPPLAATAVGVVPLHQSGMASGMNNTFRQIGIAVGIAVYGTLFSSRLSSSMRDNPAGGKHAAYADALNLLFVVSGSVAVIGALCAVLMIRNKDFVSHAPPTPEPASTVPAAS